MPAYLLHNVYCGSPNKKAEMNGFRDLMLFYCFYFFNFIFDFFISFIFIVIVHLVRMAH